MKDKLQESLKALDAACPDLANEQKPNEVPTTSSNSIATPEQTSGKSFKATAFGQNLTNIYLAEAGQVCPHCHYGILEEDISFNGTPCEFFVYCPSCNAHICTYKPMPHQLAFHLDEHLKKLYAGGFGSAKTYTCGMEFLLTVLQIPNSAGLCGASTWSQVSDTCLKFICDNLPKSLVARSNQDKVNWFIQLTNGSRISAKALDDEGKIRSANLSIIWIEEASEVDYEIVAFIAARLRNKVAFFKGKNRLKMLLSSNPDVNWLNTEWLMVSDEIHYHGEVKDRYEVLPSRRDPKVSTHISATSSNIYLPPDYEAQLAKNKEQWWINRYLKGSFKYTEGLVYPDFTHYFCEPFPIPSHWKRITGTDFGRSDPTAHVVAALDPVNKIIYIYRELEESLTDKTVAEMAEKIKKLHDFPDYMLAFPNQCDPRGRNKEQVSGKSWISEYYAHGILFQPAQGCEQNSIAPTIAKLHNYAKHGRLKIFKTCTKIYNEMSKYKYKERTLADSNNTGEKPQDKNNHLPDAIRYMLAPFPDFPNAPEDFNDVWRETFIKSNKEVHTIDNPLETEPEKDEMVDMTDNFG